MAEALAELWHLRIREELNLTEEDGSGIQDFVVQKYRGSRYSFGYPACPDMEGNGIMLDMLQSEEIGVTITENGEMEPEQTTSAFIVHHPQAKYFTIE
jgi:5-methyltetrahydrofolate--homocysteine methyltransferase